MADIPTPTPGEPRNYVAPASSGIATGTAGADDIYATADGQTLIGDGGDDVFHIGTHTGLTLQESTPGISTVSTYLANYVLPTGIDDLTADDGGSHNFTGNLGNNVIIGGTGNDTINGGGGNDLLIGGGGHDTFVIDQQESYQTLIAGPAEIADFNTATDVLDISQYLLAADPAGTDPFADGTLSLQANSNGGTDLVNDKVERSAGGAVIPIPIVTFDNVAPGAFTSADFITGVSASPSPAPAPTPTPTPSGAAEPTPDEARDYIAPNSSGIAVGTTGADDIYATGAGQTLIGNGGDDVFHIGTNTDAQIVATGTGVTTVSTYATRYTLGAGLDDLTADGDFSHTLTGNAGANFITGAGGNDVIIGGTGDWLTGGGGQDVFVVTNGDAAMGIEDMQAGSGGDVVQLVGTGWTSFAQVQANMTDLPGGDSTPGAPPIQHSSQLVLPSGERLNFVDVSMDQLTAANFTFDNSGTTPSPSPSPTPAPVPTPSPSPSAIATPDDPRGYVAPDSSGIATGSAAADDIFATANGQTLIGNGGDDIFHTGAFTGLTIEESGPGVSTVSTYLDSYVLPAGVDNLDAAGGEASTLVGNAGANVIIGNSGDDEIVGGAGNDVMTGGGGRNLFVEHAGDGQDEITDFKAGAGGDLVDLSGFGFTSFSQIQALLTARPDNQGTVLTLATGDSITFDGANGTLPPSAFVAVNFAFDNSPSPSPAPAPTPTPTPSAALPTPTPDESRAYVAPDSSGIATGSSGADDLFATGAGQTLIGNGGDDVFHLGTYTDTKIVESGTGTSAVSTYAARYVLPDAVDNLSAAGSNGQALTGNAGANVITGSTGNDTLSGGGGNDLLIGGGGTDTYKFGLGDGQDTIVNGNGPGDFGGSSGTQGQAAGQLDFGSGIAANQLWFQQTGTDGDDLTIDVMGTNDSVTVAGWYDGLGGKFDYWALSSIQTANGQTADLGDINTLVQAMATFQANNPGFDPTATAQVPNDPTLQAALAANWHS